MPGNSAITALIDTTGEGLWFSAVCRLDDFIVALYHVSEVKIGPVTARQAIGLVLEDLRNRKNVEVNITSTNVRAVKRSA